jgi:ABC-type transporter Mla maintaining outer membrane lipid asymmetry ATPase subunit MlaF
VARAIALDPRLLLLDEPLAGLSSAEATTMADLIRTLPASGITVVLVEHNLGEVLRVADRIVVLDAGRVLAEGAPAELGRDAEIGVQQIDIAARRLGGALEDAAARGQDADLVGKVEGAAGVLLDQQDGEAFLVELLQGIDA